MDMIAAIQEPTAFKYAVNFGEACMQRDAAYSHAKVKEMALNGGKVIDYFDWTKARIGVEVCKYCIE